MVILGHARARSRDVADGGEDAGRGLRARSNKALGPTRGRRRDRRHDHVRDGASTTSRFRGRTRRLAGAVYSLEVGITGTEGVLTIDDTHRDIVLAVSAPQEEGYAPDKRRLVDFMGSYPPATWRSAVREPMRESRFTKLNRVSLGLPTQAATAAGRTET